MTPEAYSPRSASDIYCRQLSHGGNFEQLVLFYRLFP
jgi:hypothetical protein